MSLRFLDAYSRVDKNLPLREQALQAFKLRNEIKMQARELMSDQELAATFAPPKTLRTAAQEAYKINEVGEQMWENILNGSQRTNRAVDQSLGLENTFAKRRNY